MKTAVTVLQELMTKLGQSADYECISQSGPQHSASFEYRCIARGVTVTATARSKKEAKQEAARRMLVELADRGENVPSPYGLPAGQTAQGQPSAGGTSVGGPGITSALGSHSYVALLKDLCEEYRLPGVEYELVGDTGPPHLRHFTMRAQLGQHTRLATATTKKAARQLAAEQLYSYMRENLARVTKDFVEEEALVRAHERAMERYVELRDEISWRPDLGQLVASYHLGLRTHIGSLYILSLQDGSELFNGERPENLDKRELARKVLNGESDDRQEVPVEDEAVLEATVAALGLTLTYSELDADQEPLCVVELAPTSPALAFAGRNRSSAISSALRYLHLALAMC